MHRTSLVRWANQRPNDSMTQRPKPRHDLSGTARTDCRPRQTPLAPPPGRFEGSPDWQSQTGSCLGHLSAKHISYGPWKGVWLPMFGAQIFAMAMAGAMAGGAKRSLLCPAFVAERLGFAWRGATWRYAKTPPPVHGQSWLWVSNWVKTGAPCFFPRRFSRLEYLGGQPGYQG